MPSRMRRENASSEIPSCWSPQGLSSGKPADCVSRWRSVMAGASEVSGRRPRSSGTWRSAGSSSDSLPSSRSLRIAIAVNDLVMLAMRKTESPRTGCEVSTSRRPVVPRWTSSPSMTMPQAAPGTFSRAVNSRMARSTSGKAAASLARRAGSSNIASPVIVESAASACAARPRIPRAKSGFQGVMAVRYPKPERHPSGDWATIRHGHRPQPRRGP